MTAPSALVVSRTVLRVAILLNILVGIVVGVLMVLQLVLGIAILGAHGMGDVPPVVAVALLATMICLPVMLRLTHLILTPLVAMVDSVSAGDSFAPSNGPRLRRIAWTLLGLEALSVLFFSALSFATDRLGAADKVEVSWTVSLSMLIAVPLLLVLARVFEEGTRMRASIEVPAGA